MQDSLDFRNPFLDNMFLQDGQYELTTDGLKVTGQNTVTTKPFRFDSIHRVRHSYAAAGWAYVMLLRPHSPPRQRKSVYTFFCV